MYDKVYLKGRLKRISAAIDVLQKKASKQHLGGQESANLRELIEDQDKFARRLKQETLKERAELRDGKTKT